MEHAKEDVKTFSCLYSVLESISAAEHRKETCQGGVVGNVVSYKLVSVTTFRLLLFWLNSKHWLGSFGAPPPDISSLAPTDTQADRPKQLCEIQMMKHRAPNTLFPISVCQCVTYLHSQSVSHWCEAVSLCQPFVLCWRKHRAAASK